MLASCRGAGLSLHPRYPKGPSRQRRMSARVDDKSVMAPQVDWRRVRTAMTICALMLMLYAILLLSSAFLVGRDAALCYQFLYSRGIVGIPCAIIASVSIVALLASSIRGEFKINVWGLVLEGPSAPITMWVVCFLSITLSIRMLVPEVGPVDKLPPYLARVCGVSNPQLPDRSTATSSASPVDRSRQGARSP